MRSSIIISALGALLSVTFANADCPAHFSTEAKELLKDSIEVEATEHQVNVVYFVPADAKPVADYERRISELLLYLQQFYAKEMDRNGFGKRAFGLNRTENGNVKILFIRGEKNADQYTYGVEGATRCLDEINAHFRAHPEDKTSIHTFVVMPTLYNSTYNDDTPGGVPFFGYGTNCFALDYVGFDIKHLGKDTKEGRLLTKWYGGFAHELGHGLNAPHNNGPASMNTEFGTPLMNAGNYTFGTSPTYLTPATCCVFDRSQTFAPKGDKTPFYVSGAPVPHASNAKLSFDGEALQLTLRCHGACRHMVAYVQEPPYAVNQDYDAVCFVGKKGEKAEDGSFDVSFTIPRSELRTLHTDKQRLELLFIEEDGNRSRWTMEFHWPTILNNPASLSMPSDITPNRTGY